MRRLAAKGETIDNAIMYHGKVAIERFRLSDNFSHDGNWQSHTGLARILSMLKPLECTRYTAANRKDNASQQAVIPVNIADHCWVQSRLEGLLLDTALAKQHFSKFIRVSGANVLIHASNA